MATKVHMEALSPTMEEGQIVRWFKSEGDEVRSGDILAEIETDKATMELAARGEGVLRKILKPEGATAPVGEVIALIGSPDEDLSDLIGDDSGAEEEESEVQDGEEEPTDQEADAPAPSEDPEASPTSDPAPSDPSGEERVKASPVARRLARDKGVALDELKGSGPGGRIVKKDVEEAGKPGPRPAGVASPPDTEADFEDFPLSQMRKTIANRLVESIGPIPHFFLTVGVDLTRASEARRRVNALMEPEGTRISYNDIVLKATALALARHPECNAHWGGDHIRRFHRVHLAVAVAIEDGLITPVIRDAHRKGLVEIAAEVRDLATRAREKKLKPEEYTGGTFSVSNLGMFGIEEFTAVINPPEAGILAVGGIEERPVVVEGELEIRSRMQLTMSCDHRVIDGAQGARFLQTLKGILEEPLMALV